MSAVEAVVSALDRVQQLEARVRAWAHLDPERACAEAVAADGRDPGLLSGLTFGVKDVFDTADQPTSYGTALYAGHRPAADAAAVALLRRAGAVCLGKTVTAELACYTPGPTTNPHRATHTPGGSSMGSAAAVACGMVDLALGTQTAASVIRPASFCGVYGFKPTFGVVSTAGMKAVAPSLDTVGWFARRPDVLAAACHALTGRPPVPWPVRPPVVALVWTALRGHCADASVAAVRSMVDRLGAAGARIDEIEAPGWFTGLPDDHEVVAGFEAARSLAYEHAEHAGRLSDGLRAMLDRGLAVDPAAYDAARDRAATARRLAADWLSGYDAVLTPAVVGEAPATLAVTGDPVFGRPWSLLGLPAVAVPGAVGPTGLPVGVQLVGPARTDQLLLALAAWAGPDEVPAVPHRGQVHG